jgi:hypothetical protein
MAEALRAERDDADLETQLTRIVTVAMRELQRRRAMVRVMILETGIHPDVARLARQHTIGRFLPMLVSVFERHARRGTIRPGSARARAQALVGMLVVQAMLRPTFDALLEPDDGVAVREYVQMVLHGILAGRGVSLAHADGSPVDPGVSMADPAGSLDIAVPPTASTTSLLAQMGETP